MPSSGIWKMMKVAVIMHGEALLRLGSQNAAKRIFCPCGACSSSPKLAIVAEFQNSGKYFYNPVGALSEPLFAG